MDQQNNRTGSVNPDLNDAKIEKNLKTYRGISILAIVMSVSAIMFWLAIISIYEDDRFAGLEEYAGFLKYMMLSMLLIPQILKLAAGILGSKVKKNPVLVKSSLILYIIYLTLVILFFIFIISQDPGLLTEIIALIYIITTLIYLIGIIKGFQIRKWVREKDAAAKQLRSQSADETAANSDAEIKTSLKWYHIISVFALVMSIIVLLILPILALLFVPLVNKFIPEFADRAELIRFLMILIIGVPEIIKLIAAITGLRVKRNPGSVTPSWILYIVYAAILIIINILSIISTIKGTESTQTFDAETCTRIVMLLIYLFEINLGYKIRKWVKAKDSRNQMPEVQIPAVQIPGRQIPDAQFPAEPPSGEQIPRE